MVDGYFLDKIDKIAQALRACSKPFGGLQVYVFVDHVGHCLSLIETGCSLRRLSAAAADPRQRYRSRSEIQVCFRVYSLAKIVSFPSTFAQSRTELPTIRPCHQAATRARKARSSWANHHARATSSCQTHHLSRRYRASRAVSYELPMSKSCRSHNTASAQMTRSIRSIRGDLT